MSPKAEKIFAAFNIIFIVWLLTAYFVFAFRHPWEETRIGYCSTFGRDRCPFAACPVAILTFQQLTPGECD